MSIDLSQAETIQNYALGSMILILIAAVVGVARLYLNERKENKELMNKTLEAFGEFRELVRNNTEVLTKVKDKI
jgi:hypothetical protein